MRNIRNKRCWTYLVIGLAVAITLTFAGVPVVDSPSSEAKGIAAAEPSRSEPPEDDEQEQVESNNQQGAVPQNVLAGYLAAVAAAQVAHQSSLTQQFVAEVTFVARMAGITRPATRAVVNAVKGIWIAGGDPSIIDGPTVDFNPESIFDQ